jgi:hypothetical protein
MKLNLNLIRELLEHPPETPKDCSGMPAMPDGTVRIVSFAWIFADFGILSIPASQSGFLRPYC